MKMYFFVLIISCLVSILHTKIYLAELGNYSKGSSGKVIRNMEKSKMIPTETGFDYTDIVYDVAEYDDSDYDIERKFKRIKTKLTNNTRKAQTGKPKRLIKEAGSDYAEIVYDDTDEQDSEPSEKVEKDKKTAKDDHNHIFRSKQVENVKKKSKSKGKETVIVEF